MLTTLYVINFLGMVLLPIVAWIIFRRKFALPWKLVLAGGLTFIASQILHIPLVIALGSLMEKSTLLVNAILLGLLAGFFEETARYILFKFILKNARTWKQGVMVGLGHGGTEALIFGVLAAVGFFTMVAYRTLDLSTVPSIPADQLELAIQQVAAYWSSPPYMAIMGFVERLSAMCLQVGLSVMVLYAIAYKKPIWFWLALLWHALVDAVAVYVVQQVGILQVEGIVAILALVTIGILFVLRSKFSRDMMGFPEQGTITAQNQAG
jgi:uncharacterized membrane protein YhfC